MLLEAWGGRLGSILSHTSAVRTARHKSLSPTWTNPGVPLLTGTGRAEQAPVPRVMEVSFLVTPGPCVPGTLSHHPQRCPAPSKDCVNEWRVWSPRRSPCPVSRGLGAVGQTLPGHLP